MSIPNENSNSSKLSWFQLLVLTPLARLRFILILCAIGLALAKWETLIALGQNGHGAVRERMLQVKGLNISAPCIPHL